METNCCNLGQKLFENKSLWLKKKHFSFVFVCHSVTVDELLTHSELDSDGDGTFTETEAQVAYFYFVF